MNILTKMFRFACFSVAIGMTVYWCYKFWKDEDLCLVDYETYDSSLDVDYPMLSFCLQDPVIESKLQQYNETLTSKKYQNYLTGLEYYDGMQNIDFNDVTVDLSEYLHAETITFNNGTTTERTYPNNIFEKPMVTYVGGIYQTGWIYKCFGLRMQKKNILYGYVAFNKSLFGSRSFNYVVTLLHYPNQTMLSLSTLKYEWPSYPKRKQIEYSMDFTITQVEVLKRRNKRTKSCVSNDISFDETIMSDHIKKNGCRAPYQNNRNDTPICSSRKEMLGAYYDLIMKIGEKTPCTSIKNIIYKYEEEKMVGEWEHFGPDYFWISLTFPNEFKDIYQERAVDIQTVIGNAGGYVGLFLGKFINLSLIMILYYLLVIMIYSNLIKSVVTLKGFALLQLPDLICYLRTKSEDWLRKLALSVRKLIRSVPKYPSSYHNENKDCNIA